MIFQEAFESMSVISGPKKKNVQVIKFNIKGPKMKIVAFSSI